MSRRLKPVSFVCVLAAAVSLAPASLSAQADLAVVSFAVNPPSGEPGGEIYIDFTIQNVGATPTVLTAILNYIFIWDTLNNDPVTQLLPDSVGCVHTFRSLLPGETDVFTHVPVTIPPDMPLDTMITLALITEYPDLEPEPDELNNMALTMTAIEPPLIPFTEMPYSAFGMVDLPYYSDVYRFDGGAGEIVYGEGIAAELGSMLDPQLNLLGPLPDTLLTPEGGFVGIVPESRLVDLGLPSTAEYRLDLFGEGGTTGMYELRLQRGIPETEPNDGPIDAQPIAYGEVHVGSFDSPGDVDWYSFYSNAGDIVIIDVDANETFLPHPDSLLDPVGVIVTPPGDTLTRTDDDDDMDPYFFFAAPEAGTYHLALEGAPGAGLGGGFPGCAYAFRISQMLGVMKPDLVVMNPQPLPGPVPAGDTAFVEFELWNVGGLKTFETGVSIDIVLAADPAFDPGDPGITLLEVFDYLEEAIDYSTGVTIAGNVPIPASTPPGSWYLGIVLDPTHDEVEEDETNNTAAIPITVDPYTDSGEPDAFPEAIALLRSYPNPTAGRSVISYELPAGGGGAPASWKVEISVYNVAGQRVARLVDRSVPTGRHQVVWDGKANGRPLPPGVYFCRMKVGDVERSFRIVLLR